MTDRRTLSTARWRRRGVALYATTLFLGLLIVAAGTSLVQRQRLERRMAADAASLEQGRLLARSALEWVLMTAGTDASWRTRYAGATTAFQVGSAGGVTVALSDADGNLADADNQLVRMSITVKTGRTVRRFEALAGPGPAPILSHAINATSSIHLGTAPTEVAGPLYATSSISKALLPLTITATKDGRFDVAPLGLVGVGLSPANILAAPVARPTIDLTALAAKATALPDMSGGGYEVRAVSATSEANSAGTPNAEGLYLINAGTLDVLIENVHIKGTLIIRASGTRTIQFGKGLVLESAAFGHPTLIIDAADGAVDLNLDVGLRESDLARDLNGDGDMTDQLRTAINGLAISSAKTNTLRTSNWLLRGCLLCRSASIDSAISIDDDARLRTDVPIGFTDGRLHLVQGSFREILP